MSGARVHAWFVTGTDTGVGKTWITAGLMRKLAGRGLRTSGMKPVASGASGPAGAPWNEDAQMILDQCTTAPSYADVNPFLFMEPVAPHVAAQREGRCVSVDPLRAAYQRLCRNADAVVVEGVGGWRVPLAPDLGTADLVAALQLPVVVVVGLRLGCINHAVLTLEAVRADGLFVCGWIGNRLDPNYRYPEATLEYLEQALPAPCLGVVPPLKHFDADAVSAAIDGDRLLESAAGK